MSWGISPWVYPVWNSLGFLDLGGYFLPHFREVFRCLAFFTVQLSHPYMTTGKTIALTRQTFVGKVMSLLFNMLSRLLITLLPSVPAAVDHAEAWLRGATPRPRSGVATESARL